MGNLICSRGKKEQSKEDVSFCCQCKLLNTKPYLFRCAVVFKASPKEDVLYATIDHGEKQTPRMLRDSVSDCDYAIVRIPSDVPSKSENNDDGADDYVLMS
ncbi:hypothetical protein AOLI_G00089610 [Acnodon oligacanthus]